MSTTHWDADAGMVVDDEQPTTDAANAEQHAAAVDELLWLITKAGPFDSPRDRAANLLAQISAADTGSSGATFAYLDTLARARRQITDSLHDGGMHCPACGQFCKAYHRALNSGMARALVELYNASQPGEWVHKPTVLRGLGAGARDESLLRFWGLLEDSLEVREDGGKSGWWRVTPLGRSFVRNTVTVQKYVTIYNGVSQGLDGPEVSIVDVLGHGFHYDELMRGV